MGNRTAFEYSIISYYPNLVRNEQLNIGLTLKNISTNKFTHYLLKENTQKIKGLVYSTEGKRLFSSIIKYLNFKLQSIENDDSQELIHDNYTDSLPDGITISQPKKAITDNPQELFQALLDTYIGKQFIEEPSESQIITPKQYGETIFKERSLLGSKVKKNVRLRPSQQVSMRLQIDFAFEDSGKLGLINAIPSIESAEEWYSKMVLLTSRYEGAGKIIFLNNSRIYKKDTITQMLNDLQVSDERVTTFDVGNERNGDGKEGFLKLTDKIESNSNEQILENLLQPENISA